MGTMGRHGKETIGQREMDGVCVEEGYGMLRVFVYTMGQWEGMGQRQRTERDEWCVCV